MSKSPQREYWSPNAEIEIALTSYPKSLVSASKVKYCFLSEQERTEKEYEAAVEDEEQRKDDFTIVNLALRCPNKLDRPEKTVLVPTNLKVADLLRELTATLKLDTQLCNVELRLSGTPETIPETYDFKDIALEMHSRGEDNVNLDFVIKKSPYQEQLEQNKCQRENRRMSKDEEDAEVGPFKSNVQEQASTSASAVLPPEDFNRQGETSQSDRECQDATASDVEMEEEEEEEEERQTPRASRRSSRQMTAVVENEKTVVAIAPRKPDQEAVAAEILWRTRKPTILKDSVSLNRKMLLEEKMKLLTTELARKTKYVFLQTTVFSALPMDSLLVWKVTETAPKPFSKEATIRAIREYKMLCVRDGGSPGTFLETYYNYSKRPSVEKEMNNLEMSRHLSRWACDQAGVFIPRLDKVRQVLLFFLSIGIPGETRRDWEEMYGLLNWAIPESGFPVIDWD